MAQQSIFRDFVAALKKHWQDELPQIREIDSAASGPMMPKASTFYAGFSTRLAMHVFIHFQHSPKAWQVGQFTVNFIISQRQGPTEIQGRPLAPSDGVSYSEGNYRISSVLGRRKDKWWHLKKDKPPILFEAWRPSQYDDRAAVLREAAEDVTRDVRDALVRFGIGGGTMIGSNGEGQ